MKSHLNIIRSFLSVGVFTIFIAFAIISSSVSAQEETFATPTVTPTPETTELLTATATTTPIEATEESAFFPTITPTAFIEETLPQPQEEERQAAPFQAMQGATSNLESIWPAFNISDTDTASIDPGIAVDSAGRIHMVWAEAEEGNKWEIYYAYWDGVRLSQSVNVSKSPSFSSGDPQIALDSSGNVHIVWGEEDNDYVNDAEIMYNHCSMDNNGITTCATPISLSGPPDNWKCGNYVPGNSDIRSDAPTISVNDSNKIMVVWRAWEPGRITQPYSVWQVGATPPTIRTGCAPMVTCQKKCDQVK